jgi:beta-hydroxyacyl-ACP dehydratase FabZ
MAVLNIEDIMKILPHRYPMLLVDRIIECDDAKRCVGLKNLTINEPFFQGHFPGFPVMPGVLQLEAMAQTAGILLNRISKREGKVTYFVSIDNARFRKVIKPGDQMRMELEVMAVRSRSAKFSGKVLVDGAVACEAEMMCMIPEGNA